MQVANHQQLHSTKRVTGMSIPAQDFIDRIEQIGSDHTDLVDDQQIETANETDLCSRDTMLPLILLTMNGRKVQTEGELKKRVNRHAAGIDGRDPCGRDDDEPLQALGFDLVQERGLATAGLTGQEDTLVGIANVLECEFQFWIGLQVHSLILNGCHASVAKT
jgi:hypothetical protein